ncbi:class I SAM-dependent methyltransferase [Paraliomyxa miuraensis]|uniref:class I SAM-dependent methyltransferase n=1 Tax=Paraliomyxa miuraensis TaxID=376150 RepID=UPI002251BF9E|nr:class I SAM-dependent methyltransferase [Paraliomyxa miuraensis]MCX4241593.1 class I SAM-dependent methyltransferase [Paraliomyxa miuraensis]
MKAAAYDRIYGNAIHAELATLGPEELTDPRVLGLSNGFLVFEDLTRVLEQLRGALAAGEREHPLLLDLGCGRGGIGRWLATRLGARLVGVDGSEVAIAQARSSASPEGHERFVVGDFAATGLAAGSVAAAFSHDALYMAEEPAAALAEAHRVLRPAGVLAFTTYSSVSTPWEALAERSGFVVEQVDELTARWRAVMRAKHERRWSMRHVLRARHGRSVEPELSVTASMLGLGGRRSAIEHIERRSLLLRRG